MKPHIVQIVFHDLGRHLSCYGKNSLETPALDAVAADGVRLDNMFCTAPQCSPSRASLMTGRYPHANGMFGLVHNGWSYHAGERRITDELHAVGYKTVLLGHQHESDGRSRSEVGQALGYDEVPEVPLPHYSDYIADSVCDYLSNRIDQHTPHFICIGLFDVHRPNFGDPVRHHRESLTLPSYIPDTPGARLDYARLETMAHNADEMVGRIIETLEAVLVPEETLLIVTTDHGPAFTRAKMTLYDPGIRIAALLRWSGHLPTGTVPAGMYSNIDILPTVLEAIGAGSPASVHGRSMWRDLTEGQGDGREYVFAEKTAHGYLDPMRSIRSNRYKYIRNYKPEWPMQINPRHAMAVGIDEVESQHAHPRLPEELYDLATDPDEQTNVAMDPAYESVRADMARLLLDRLVTTGDPVALGKAISFPSGHSENPQWEYSAGSGRFRLTPEARYVPPEKLKKRPMRYEDRR